MDTNTADINKALFLELVQMLSFSAMQQLGKLINPMTGKTEMHLEAAQATIDMLTMFQAKTAGNLDKDEDRLLRSTLAMLQMNYVETARAAPAAKAAGETAPPAGETPAPAAAEGSPAAEPAAGDAGKQEPRFRKTYG
jgi:hypothetical protein